MSDESDRPSTTAGLLNRLLDGVEEQAKALAGMNEKLNQTHIEVTSLRAERHTIAQVVQGHTFELHDYGKRLAQSEARLDVVEGYATLSSDEGAEIKRLLKSRAARNETTLHVVRAVLGYVAVIAVMLVLVLFGLGHWVNLVGATH